MCIRDSLGGVRQCRIEISLPSRRIDAFAKAMRCCVVEYQFNPRSDPGGGFGLGGPDRLQDTDHVSGPNVSNRHLSDRRLSVRAQRCGPLSLMLRVLPGLLVLSDVL